MKILVPVKRVVDYNVKVRVKADQSGVELANVKMSMNPFDEIAVEEALKLKEAGIASEIVVVSIEVKILQSELRMQRLHNKLLEEIIRIGGIETGIDLKKKFGTKRS